MIAKWLYKIIGAPDCPDKKKETNCDALTSGKNGAKKQLQDEDELQSIHDAEEALKKLQSLVGLWDIKKQVEKLTAFAWMNKVRASKGLANHPMSLHMAFKGNPGTGKTTVARVLGEILHAMGVLENPTVVEVSRGDLIGEYIGQSLPKVNKVISRAKGGILLIDEAYGIVRSDSMRDYGYEVLDHLVKVMEDKRDEIMIIFTGYQKELDDFLTINTGLKSRINYHMEFPDYSAEELLEIFLKLAEERNYEVSLEAQKKLKESLRPHPDNGRYVRNILERSIIKKATNLYLSRTESDFKLLTADDIVLPPPEMVRGVAGFVQN